MTSLRSYIESRIDELREQVRVNVKALERDPSRGAAAIMASDIARLSSEITAYQDVLRHMAEIEAREVPAQTWEMLRNVLPSDPRDACDRCGGGRETVQHNMRGDYRGPHPFISIAEARQ